MTLAILKDKPRYRKKVGKKPYAVECLPHNRWWRKADGWSVWAKYETPEGAERACETLNRTKSRYATYRVREDTK